VLRVAACLLVAALAAAGCGSVAPADLPAPAGPPASPPLRVTPAGVVVTGTAPRAGAAQDYALDRRSDRLSHGTRSVSTCREPVALTLLGRGTRVAVLCGRERVVEIHDATTLQPLGRVSAGIGPTALASDEADLFYVIDALGQALLVYHLHPLELVRRVHLGGGPYAVAFDRERRGLWITLNGANQIVDYVAGSRPVIRGRLASIPDARSVSVTGDVLTVASRAQRQTLHLRHP
jgi:hypothetical protein